MKYKTTVNDFITTTENDCKILISAQKVERIPIIILTIHKILYKKKISRKNWGLGNNFSNVPTFLAISTLMFFLKRFYIRKNVIFAYQNPFLTRENCVD